jgi:acyl-CoA thioester hydrolase
MRAVSQEIPLHEAVDRHQVNVGRRRRLRIFRNDDETAAAQGHFVHVYVDRAGNRPVSALPEALRAVLQPLLLVVGG